MNHNLLISKYLDGDLSHEEDNELRRLLSDDSAIKEEFDAATMLHFMMKEDAESIVPPADFILLTEDLILGKYADLSQNITSSQKPNSGTSTSKFVSAVAVLLLLFVLPFGDTSHQIIDSFTDTRGEFDLAPSVENAAPRSMIRTGKAVHHNTTAGALRQSTSPSIPSSSLSDGHTASGLEHGTEDGRLAAAAGSNKPDTEQDLASGLGLESTPNAPTATIAKHNDYPTDGTTGTAPKIHVPGIGMSIAGLHSMLPYIQSEQANSPEIQVSTFVSTMITLPTTFTNTTANFSQSIAYSLGDNNRVGMEVGYFGYSYQDGGTVLVPRSGAVGTSNKTLGMDDPAPGANDVSIERSSLNMSAGFDERKVEYSLDKNMYWGAAFYEHTLFNTGKISFNGRVGVGGSSDGPMAFSRAFARYNVFSGIALTLGAEANAFMLHAPMISGRQFDVSSGVSLVYGMQVKF